MKRRRQVLKLWVAVLLTFVGILAIAGGTVLALYFMGKLSDEVVEPGSNSLSFTELDENEMGYLDFSIDDTYYYNVAGDFEMTINCSTEGVTVTNVTLSLANSINDSTLPAGYITDGIITIPQQVTLNESFTVTVNRLEDYTVVGGVSIITAVSDGYLANRLTAIISVDVPATNIVAYVSGSSNTEGTQNVVIGTDFYLETEFTPTASKYLFSDTTTEKTIFYVVPNNLEIDYETGKFTANTSGTYTIQVYAFSNSYYQKVFLDANGNLDAEELNNAAITYFNSNPEVYVSTTVTIEVGDVEVTDLRVSTNSFDVTADTKYVLTANSTNGNGSLGLSVLVGVDNFSSLYGRAAIKVTSDDITIVGGKVIKVTVDETGSVLEITQENYDSTKSYVSTSTEIYYIQPNTSPREYADYYWQITSSEECSVTTSVNYFYQDSFGQWQMFLGFENEKTITFNVTVSTSEISPSWLDSDIILEIDYTQEQETIKADVDLSTYLAEVSSSNIYTRVVYFLLDDSTSDTGSLDNSITEIFNVKAGVTYGGLSIGNTYNTSGSYTLYEIEGTVLTALKAYSSGSVKVVAVIVKTDADGNIVYDEDGKYIIINMSRAKVVTVNSLLSIYNMSATFTLTEEEEYRVESNTGITYYLPAFNLNEDGSQKTMISFTLELTVNTSTDVENLITAYRDGNLTVDCYYDGAVVEYITLESLTHQSTEGNVATFTGELKIDETYCLNNRSTLQHGLEIYFRLTYDNGTTERTSLVTNANNANVYTIVLYSPVPTALTGAYEETEEYLNSVVSATVTTSGVSITWGNNNISSIDALNLLLTFTMTDQYGFTIDPNDGLYDIQFSENSSSTNVLGFNSSNNAIISFSAGTEVSTQLIVSIVDQKTNSTVTGDNLTKTINFEVDSEGVSLIRITPSDEILSSGGYGFTDALSTSAVTISRYVRSGDTETLANILQVYTGTTSGGSLVESLMFQLNLSRYSSTNQAQLLKMVTFYDSNGGVITTFNDNTAISYMTFNGVFKEATNLYFTVTSASNSSLFSIELTYTCMPLLTMTDSFSNYSEAYANYLVSSENALVASVFADESYLLSTYLPVSYTSTVTQTSGLWSWVSSGNISITSSSDDTSNSIFNSETNILTLSISGTNLYLNIDAVYQFTTASFTLYFGVRSSYALSITVTLYINPNIIIEEKVSSLSSSAFVNLQNFGSVTDNFNFYKATSYIAGTLTPISDFYSGTNLSSSLTFTNTSNDIYLSISNGAYSLATNGNLELTLTQQLEQTFQIIYNDTTIDAIRVKAVYDDNGQVTDQQFILCTASEHAEISVLIGYGENEQSVIEAIFADGEDLQIVTYNGEKYLLLTNGQTYTLINGFTIYSRSGDLYDASGGGILTSTGSFISFDNSVTISNSDETIKITIPIIVSMLGDKIFEYGEGFNTFTNEDGEVDFSVLLGNQTSLTDNGVYATISAGTTTTILHNLSKNADTSGIGIYYLNDNMGVSWSFSASIVSATGVLNDATVSLLNMVSLDSSLNDDGEIEITLNHLSNNYTDVYVVVMFTFTRNISSDSLSIYLRLKVETSFEAGSVTYPYADSAEYLDEKSVYYSDGTYTIDLEETLDSSNSKFTEETKRFGDVSIEDEKITSVYQITSIIVGGTSVSTGNYSTYFDYTIADTILTITPKTFSTIQIVVQNSFYYDGALMIGSELSYTFIFNQSVSYNHSITQVTTITENEESKKVETPLSSTNDIYDITLQAGSNETEYVIQIILNSATVDSFGVNMTGDYEDALQQNNGTYYTLTDNEVSGANAGTKTLTITPKTSVDKDYVVTIIIYTDRVVCVLNITVTGIYSYELNNIELSGGNTYNLINENNGIFKTLEGESFTIALSDQYDEETKASLEKLYIYNSTTIEFAHLTEDTTFIFDVTINEGRDDKYTFTIELVVKESLDDRQRTYQDNSTSYYSGATINVDMSTLLTAIDLSSDDVYSNGTGNGTGFAFDTGGSTSASFTAQSVGLSTVCYTTLTIYYVFNGEALYQITLNYYYTALPNVSLSVNYPQPDGENNATYTIVTTSTTMDAEYLQATTEGSVTVSDFFTSTADLAKGTRVAVGTLVENITPTWIVSIETISNLTVNNQTSGTIENPNSDLTFTLTNGATTGYVTFTITVNLVSVSYTVVVTSASIYSFANYIPEIDNTGEVIYAEDMAELLDDNDDDSSVLNIFQQERILNYTLRTSGTYYLKYVKSETDFKIITISGTAGENVNKDLGFSLSGYTYDGTYRYSSGSDVSTKLDDSEIYSSAPILVARVVVRYADGSIIVLSKHSGLSITYDSESQDNYSLVTTTDTLQTVNLSFGTSTDTILTGTYSYTLKLDFAVSGNADSATNYTTYNINAGTSISLLSDTQSTFGIQSSKTGEYYSSSDISNNNATLTLQVYGFATLPIDTAATINNIQDSASLDKVAGAIHNYLVSTTYSKTDNSGNTQYYKYYTGLTPRAGGTINSISGGINEYDYIVIENNGNDWTIRAQGANNDGNYVMILLTYSVELGNETITSSHNLLFFVQPNSTVSYSSSPTNSAANVSGDSTKTNGEQTYVSNELTPYEINESDLGNDGTLTIDLYDVIFAYMRGSSSNQISTFDSWTISLNETIDGATYNNESYINSSSTNVLTLGSSSWEKSNDSDYYSASITSSTDSLELTLSSSNLGEKLFYVEFEDPFGFIGRFYFKVVSSDNPEIYSLTSTTLTEGSYLAFASQYTTMTTANISGYDTYYSFNYSYSGSNNDEIEIALDTNTVSINYRIQLTLQNAMTVSSVEIPANTVLERTGTAANISTATIEINGENTEWTYYDSNNAAQTVTLTDAQLMSAGATVQFSMTIYDNITQQGSTSLSSTVLYTLTYADEEQAIAYEIGNRVSNPGITNNIEDGINDNPELTTVIFSGLTAYAFDTNSAIDKTSLEEQSLYSNIGNLKVTKVTFTYDNGEISDTQEVKLSGLSFLTAEGLSFIDEYGAETEGSGLANSGNTLVVPTFKGIDFGTGNLLTGVIMTVTIQDTSTGETCEVTRTVNIQRAVSTSDIFTSTAVLDGESVSGNVSGSLSGSLLNDTLEIDLEAGESMTLVVHNEQLEYVNGNYYFSTSDEAISTGKTYYTISDGVATAVTTPQQSLMSSYYELFTPNYVTISNQGSYAVTEYVGISASMASGVLTENLEEDSEFYVYVYSYTTASNDKGVSDAVIYYNGTQLTVSSDGEVTLTSNDEEVTLTIAELDNDALTLNIENTSALTNNQMTKRLYFLYTSSTSGETYQIQQEFTVYPYYTSAEAENAAALSGAIYVDVSGKQPDDDGYYTLELSDWASEIALTKGNESTSSGDYLTSGNVEKFYFEIASGNATIDEDTGVIKTNMTEIQYITVNVYIKVSGIADDWDSDNGTILIGTFEIRLDYDGSSSSA